MKKQESLLDKILKYWSIIAFLIGCLVSLLYLTWNASRNAEEAMISSKETLKVVQTLKDNLIPRLVGLEILHGIK